jgi:hypothetical protein
MKSTIQDLVNLLHKTANTTVSEIHIDLWRSDIKSMEDGLVDITTEIQKNGDHPFDVVWKRKYEYIYNKSNNLTNNGKI